MNSRNALIVQLIKNKQMEQIKEPEELEEVVEVNNDINQEEEEEPSPKEKFFAIVNGLKKKKISVSRKRKMLKQIKLYFKENFPIFSNNEDIF